MPRETYDSALAANIRAARSRKGLQQEPLAARMRALGYSAWLRQTVANVEKGRRRVTAEEIFGLAIALEVTIPQLTGPSDPDGDVEFPNGMAIHSSSVERLAGRGINDHAVQWHDDGSPAFFRYTARPSADSFDRSLFGPAMAAQGWPGEPTPAAQPVVAAIVTSELGVLVGHRNDRTPPWTFIAGEQEPGESPADTIVREVKEETALEVRAGQIIGERDHPATGRHMIYMAARPVRGTKVIVGDEAELDDVRWLDLDEVTERMPDMFGRVRAYLEGEIGGAE